ncbi:MAG: 23S rRNA (pseudouridine(1915)-N(3))-methyltransferase RlmH [Lachnospiraceae bacterium]|nr:23S rRNA (pseudouridine(1915)-N(3))-methyltransferase RlmH [Lachnospiraceae bacterium]
MKINIICVGKIKENFYKEALAEYAKRLSKYCDLKIIEVADEKTPENISDHQADLIMEKEGKRILDKIPEGSYICSLAIEGKKLDSVDFAGKISGLMTSGQGNISFIIGGSLGLCKEIKSKSDMMLSFSDMTFPHQLMRVILTEQIYRSFRIINNEPYHK